MESEEDLEIQELIKSANLDLDTIDQEIAQLELDEDETPNLIDNLDLDKMEDKDVEKLADDFIKIKDRQELKKKRSDLLIQIVRAINFDVHSIDDIAKLTFDRDFLKDMAIQNKIIAFIPELRTCYNSAYLTCLHQNAQDKQKNLGINILRQILKCNYLKMTPKVVSHGYDKTTGKKLVSRIYLIQKLLY
jgi:hypothetical protein